MSYHRSLSSASDEVLRSRERERPLRRQHTAPQQQTPLQARQLDGAARLLTRQLTLVPPTEGEEQEEEEHSTSQRMRLSRTLDELISTERTFVDAVRSLRERYWPAIQHSVGLRAFSQVAAVACAFSSAASILTLSQEFLRRLEEEDRAWHASAASLADGEYSSASLAQRCDRLAAVLELFAPLFIVFGEFAAAHAATSDELELLSASTTPAGLQAALITPIQRLPRYLLLLQEAQKHAGPTPALGRAIEAVRDTALAVNERVRAQEQTRDLWRLFDSLGSSVGDLELVRPGRWIVRQGRLLVPDVFTSGASEGRLKHVYLCNDLLLVSSPSGAQLLTSVHIDAATVVVKLPSLSEEPASALQVVGLQRTVVLVAPDAAQRDAWAAVVQECVESAEEKTRTVQSQRVRPEDRPDGVLPADSRKAMSLLGSGRRRDPRREARRARNAAKLHELAAALGDDSEVHREPRRWFLKEGMLTLVQGSTMRLVRVVLCNDVFVVAAVCGLARLQRLCMISLGEAFLRDTASPRSSFIVDAEGRPPLTLSCPDAATKQRWLAAVAKAGANYSHGVWGGESGDEDEADIGRSLVQAVLGGAPMSTEQYDDDDSSSTSSSLEAAFTAAGSFRASAAGHGVLENTSFLSARLAQQEEGESAPSTTEARRRFSGRFRRRSDRYLAPAPEPVPAPAPTFKPVSDLAACRREAFPMTRVTDSGRKRRRGLVAVDGEALVIHRSSQRRLSLTGAHRGPTQYAIDDLVSARLVGAAVVQVQFAASVELLEAASPAEAQTLVSKLGALLEMSRSRRLQLHGRLAAEEDPHTT